MNKPWGSKTVGWRSRALVLLIATVMLAIAGLSQVRPAIASIHTYREQPGQVTFRSQQSLRDRRDRAWQAVLFKRYRVDQPDGLYLRLVGFPGAVAVDATRPLTIDTGTALSWQAPFALDGSVLQLPPNVGQYAMQPVLDQIQQPIPLQIAVPLQTGGIAELVAAPFVVEEWQALNQRHPDRNDD
ncbi:MAG: DUF3122 domain-containing protein [Cyanobacteria bacterium P01_A01_bin.123]